jgi:hypothetical protein
VIRRRNQFGAARHEPMAAASASFNSRRKREPYQIAPLAKSGGRAGGSRRQVRARIQRAAGVGSGRGEARRSAGADYERGSGAVRAASAGRAPDHFEVLGEAQAAYPNARLSASDVGLTLENSPPPVPRRYAGGLPPDHGNLVAPSIAAEPAAAIEHREAGRGTDQPDTQRSLLALLRQSICSRLPGYEGVNDAERLCHDPAMRIVVGGRAMNQTAASASEMARFETETLSSKENLKHLMDLSGQWIDQAHPHRRLTKLIVDMDSSVSETYGQQQGSAYNGHFGCTCYHPLFLFNQFGNLERVLLRRGNLGSAQYWRRVRCP